MNSMDRFRIQLAHQLQAYTGQSRTTGSPPGVPPEVMHLARALAQFPAPQTTCATCKDELPNFVDAEMLGEGSAEQYRAVKDHLDLCPGCTSVYQDLLEVAWLLATDSFPRPAHIPPPDLSFLNDERSRR